MKGCNAKEEFFKKLVLKSLVIYKQYFFKNYLTAKNISSSYLTRYLYYQKYKYICMCVCVKSESESPSVVSESLWPHGLYIVHGILQARILDWVAFPFSGGSSQPRDWTQVSHLAGGFFTSWTHKESPRISELVVYPFSSGSSRPRNWTRVSCIAGRFFTNWAIYIYIYIMGCFRYWFSKILQCFFNCYLGGVTQYKSRDS